MRALALVLLATLGPLAVQTLAISASTSALARRSQFCVNAPNTKAGTILHRRTLEQFNSPEHRRSTSTKLWCAQGSATYVLITMTELIPESVILHILRTGIEYIADYIGVMGDGMVPNGGVVWPGPDHVSLVTWNLNNHQTTWGVLGAALEAVRECMSLNGYGGARFSINDGPHEVGAGALTFS